MAILGVNGPFVKVGGTVEQRALARCDLKVLFRVQPVVAAGGQYFGQSLPTAARWGRSIR